MKNMIITNNPAVAEKKDNVLFVDGSAEETLIKVRDLVHQGYELISHPLAASLRMMFSPFRSVILGKKSEKMDVFSTEIIEDSIIKYKMHMDFRKRDTANDDDYQMIDLILLEAALHEQSATW
ncbi:GrdX family protein [Desulfosporosinus metallidurans]|uniref:GrdX protein n=1 Tax=Desulfosporosinus metallidurans TaxID=1888891 RepID=A0A1Q8QXJ2_9FIRM|nr:GrdX family protein [Desulfosporosinus metallidurans]OLN32058.1 GrdX protein [Desulfosporosinus metallidurans]